MQGELFNLFKQDGNFVLDIRSQFKAIIPKALNIIPIIIIHIYYNYDTYKYYTYFVVAHLKKVKVNKVISA